jgi:hypothetical protein
MLQQKRLLSAQDPAQNPQPAQPTQPTTMGGFAQGGFLRGFADGGGAGDSPALDDYGRPIPSAGTVPSAPGFTSTGLGAGIGEGLASVYHWLNPMDDPDHPFWGRFARAEREARAKPDEYNSDNPTISREADAETLSLGRRQGKDIDLNLTPVPDVRSVTVPDKRPDLGWLPWEIPTTNQGKPILPYPNPGRWLGTRLQSGGTVDGAGPPQEYALGGFLRPGGGADFPERGIAASGLLHTAGPGRTDNLNIQPHADSYVLPTDVVSGLGQGSTLAGAKALDMALHTGPYGTHLPSAPHHSLMPHGFHKGIGRTHGAGFAEGGAMQEGEAKRVPIVAAGGEYIVSPEQVRAIGDGDIQRGHDVLDKFVLHCRARTIKDLKGLKGPVKDDRRETTHEGNRPGR